MPSILRNNSRFRRDQRQPPEEEEMWFNEEDDFDDVPTDTKMAPDLDNSISKSTKSSSPHTSNCVLTGKIMDKKADMINGPKSHHPQVTATPNAQQSQTPSTQTIVNSTNNNISVSNNSRKSSETVTSEEAVTTSTEEQEKEAQPEPKAQSEEATTPTVNAAKALAAALGEEEEEKSAPKTSSPVPQSEETQEEQHPPQLTPSSDTLNVDSSNSEEMAVTSEKVEEPVVVEAKSDEESCKKVRISRQTFTREHFSYLFLTFSSPSLTMSPAILMTTMTQMHRHTKEPAWNSSHQDFRVHKKNRIISK